jgi:hypothetical protein
LISELSPPEERGAAGGENEAEDRREVGLGSYLSLHSLDSPALERERGGGKEEREEQGQQHDHCGGSS